MATIDAATADLIETQIAVIGRDPRENDKALRSLVRKRDALAKTMTREQKAATALVARSVLRLIGGS